MGLSVHRRFSLDGIVRVFKTKDTDLAKLAEARMTCKDEKTSASSRTTKFITDAMQKLTLTVICRKDGERRFVLSNFNPMNEAVLRCYGLFSEVPTM